MITSIIGKTFLKAFNEKNQSNLSAKEFFDTEYFKLFFDHPKYLQWVINSPFVQMKSGQKSHLLTPEERAEKLEALHDKVANEAPDASFALGYPASSEKKFATTSGLVTDIPITCNEEEIYCSWIGSGLGIGVEGSYSLLINEPKLLLLIYEGWKHYRDILNDPVLKLLKGNQINSWNGQWITYRLGKNYREESSNLDIRQKENIFSLKKKKNEIEINTVNWSNVFFSLTTLYPNQTLMAYIYAMGKTNTTIGFIPFYLKSATKLKDVYKQLYKNTDHFDREEFQALYGMDIIRACELGSIGLQALCPQNLRKFMREADKAPFNTKNIDIYKSYKTWLIAMLSRNKEEITNYTSELAKLLLRYEDEAQGRGRANLIEAKLFKAKSKQKFIEAIIEMIEDIDDNDLEQLKTLKNEVHMMTHEEFIYFITLLKFDYFFLSKTQSKEL
ncbi:hypothetical protein HQ36_05340 [Porphyromonas gingivicanis]|uniref:Uncharacterized protein n=1 Tax=Porphyromonas gingivicanis TaxID=266762 RepID=A0A0A2G5Q1_9PORP|nr:hypothetical protein [Porphyromonas gingivicanis]KGN97700.1 hypothetical protein HQ36_05340 [Porphyromonas gingivicanis]